MTWTTLAHVSDLTTASRLTAGAVTLIRDQERWHAIASRCPHMGYPMEKATLREGVVTCAWHRWEFDLTTGGCYRGACADLPVYPLRIHDGCVQVALDAVAGQAQEAAVARLRDRLLEGDPYQIARSIAECLEVGLPPHAIVMPVVHHGFAHAIAAHRSSQATAELIEVVEGARMAEHFQGRERILPLLHGVMMVGSGVGSRPAVGPLPGAGDSQHRAMMLERYVDDPSALAIERLLSDWPDADAAFDSRLIALAAAPRFLPNPGVLIDLIDALELVTYLGSEAAAYRAPLVAWILGVRRADPQAEERLAIAWLESHLAEAMSGVPATSAAFDSDLLLPVYAAPSPQDALTHVWGLMSRVGFSPLQIIDGFSQIEARRLAKLRPNNGGLWSTPIAGIRLADAWQRASPRADHQTMVLGAMQCAWHAFSSRWLALGEAWSEKPTTIAPSGYAEAFATNDVPLARQCAVALSAGVRDAGTWGALLQPIIDEDLGGGRLRFIAALLRSQRRQSEWQPWIAGLVGHAMDQRNQHDRSTAARFGRSMLSRKAGAESSMAET